MDKPDRIGPSFQNRIRIRLYFQNQIRIRNAGFKENCIGQITFFAKSAAGENSSNQDKFSNDLKESENLSHMN